MNKEEKKPSTRAKTKTKKRPPGAQTTRSHPPIDTIFGREISNQKKKKCQLQLMNDMITSLPSGRRRRHDRLTCRNTRKNTAVLPAAALPLGHKSIQTQTKQSSPASGSPLLRAKDDQANAIQKLSSQQSLTVHRYDLRPSIAKNLALYHTATPPLPQFPALHTVPHT